jgi:hypothetical protein
MKKYVSYLENITIDAETHERTMRRLERHETPKRRIHARLRPAVIFAALAVFMAATALAAVVHIGRTYVGDTGYGPAFISPVEKVAMSEAMRQYIAMNEPEKTWPDGSEFDFELYDYARYSINFSSFTEAGVFFGVNIAKNNMIGSPGTIRAEVLHFPDDSGTVHLFTFGWRVSFSYGQSGEAEEHIFGVRDLEAQLYVSQVNGIEAQVGATDAVFILDNLVYNISVFLQKGDSDTLEKIIDAFEF